MEDGNHLFCTLAEEKNKGIVVTLPQKELREICRRRSFPVERGGTARTLFFEALWRKTTHPLILTLVILEGMRISGDLFTLQ